MFLSDWAALYAGSPIASTWTARRWGFLAQAPLGTPAVYALVQQGRYNSPENVKQMGLDQPLSAPFEGIVRFDVSEGSPGKSWTEVFQTMKEAARKAAREGGDVELDTGFREPEYQYYRLKGNIELRPGTTSIGPIVEGTFAGHINLWNPETQTYEETGDAVELNLSSEVGRFEIDRKIYADRERALKIPILGESQDGRPQKVGVLRGTIPRSVVDWVAVPLEAEKLNRLHYELGKTYDLAMVYTWIAALLNVLVMWDAFEGPAYGYGDEKPEDEADPSKPGGKDQAADKSPAKSEDTAPAPTAG
jgi:hypothetical protein